MISLCTNQKKSRNDIAIFHKVFSSSYSNSYSNRHAWNIFIYSLEITEMAYKLGRDTIELKDHEEQSSRSILFYSILFY